jgi:uncharacterized membrane protein
VVPLYLCRTVAPACMLAPFAQLELQHAHISILSVHYAALTTIALLYAVVSLFWAGSIPHSMLFAMLCVV